MSQCPYCGRADGTHMWAGQGGCPGALSERVTDMMAADVIRGKDLVISTLEYRLATMQRLCLRAADALEDFAPGLHKLIAELREAGK